VSAAYDTPTQYPFVPVFKGPAFQEKLEEFQRENSPHFEDVEENKLIYMDFFKQYVGIFVHLCRDKAN
jgi:hypothetical protein